jgi:outer membrane receptor for ferric coprogen and ferric-rhodotorulic acid
MLPTAVAAACGLALEPAFGQDNTAPAAGTASAPTVVVTGQRDAPSATSNRLPLSWQDTPQSLTRLDQVQIEQQSLFSVDQVMRNIPGVNVGFWDTQRPLYFARGFQITDFQVDGIPTYSGSTNQEYDTAFYERVEVVRGANGLLSGAGLPSATVNLVRKRAQKTLGGSAALSLGRWDFTRGEADINLALTRDGSLRARVIGTQQRSDSHLDRYHEKKAAWMAVVEADLGSHTTLTLGRQAQNNDPRGSIWGTIPRFAADGSEAQLDRSTSLAPSWTHWSRYSATTFVNLDQKLWAGWRLQASLARTEGNVSSLRVYGSGYPDLANQGAGIKLLAGVGLSDDVRDNVDLSLSGQFSLWGRQHDVVLGYLRNDLAANTTVLSSVASWSYTIPNLNTWDGQAPQPVYAPTGARRTTETNQNGSYAMLRLRATDGLALVAGARLSQWATFTDNWSTSGAYTGRTAAYEVKDELTPYVGGVWAISPQWSAYASHTAIFRPQNYRDRDNQPLAPVNGSNAEAGLKGALLGGRLNVSAAWFNVKQDNYAVRDASQAEGSLPDGGSAYVGVNGTASKGLELEVSGQVSRQWSLQGGYTLTRTERHANDLIYANLPEHYVQLQSQWKPGLAQGRLSLGAGLNWQSAVYGYKIPHPTLGTTTVRQGSYTLLSANASWQASEHLGLTLAITNLADKTYWSTLDYPNYGQPRNVSLSARWRM